MIEVLKDFEESNQRIVRESIGIGGNEIYIVDMVSSGDFIEVRGSKLVKLLNRESVIHDKPVIYIERVDEQSITVIFRGRNYDVLFEANDNDCIMNPPPPKINLKHNPIVKPDIIFKTVFNFDVNGMISSSETELIGSRRACKTRSDFDESGKWIGIPKFEPATGVWTNI